MALGFKEGYEYFEKSSGALLGAHDGGILGIERVEYIATVKNKIGEFEKSLNDFVGYQTSNKILKGDIAEHWHYSTFNINAAINKSPNRVFVDRSHEFGSTDISSNFGQEFGLKYYESGSESARQQATSVGQRFKEYQARGGTDSLDKYLDDRNRSIGDAVLFEPVYSSQKRVIPTDQLNEARAWLKRQILSEEARRPEQVKRYQETLDMLSDKLSDNVGNESIPLNKDEAERIAEIAREGKFNAVDYGVVAPETLPLELLMKESLKAGLSAMIISAALRIGPEIYKSIDYLIKNGEIDEEQLRMLGFAAVKGSPEDFIRGSIASALTASCKGGLLGEFLKDISPSVVGAITVITINTLKNAYLVAKREKTRFELTDELLRDMFLTASLMTGGVIGQALIHVPIFGYLLGSFLGSVTGSFTYNIGYKTVISFCVETGITMFGLVDQDYLLPDDIIKNIGMTTFDYESFKPETFKFDTFELDTFGFDSIQPDSLSISYLRRGVIGVSKIGYVV